MSVTFTTDLGAIRALVHRCAREAGLSESRAIDLVLAVSEVAANTVRHARSAGTLDIWHDADEIVCQVKDKGFIRDPLAGTRRPAADAMGGHGLWLVNQVCDRVDMRSDENGTTIRLHMFLKTALADATGAGGVFPPRTSCLDSGPRAIPPARRLWYNKGVDLLTLTVPARESAGEPYTLVTIAGEADVTNREELRRVLDGEVAQQPRMLILDLSGLRFMDSSALHVILQANRALDRHGGMMALVAPQDAVAKMLRLTTADRLIPVFGTIAEAAAG